MPTRTQQVQDAIAICHVWYARYGEDVRLITERTEELWYEVEDHIEAMQMAEEKEDEEGVEAHLAQMIRCLERAQEEIRRFRG